MSGSWSIELHDAEGKMVDRKEGLLDPLEELVQLPAASPRRGAARISATYGTQYDFGRIKASFTVSLTCDQSTEVLERAAEIAFLKAVDLTEEGMKLVINAMQKNGAG